MGSLVCHLPLCSRSQYQLRAVLPVDVCGGRSALIVSVRKKQECVPACCIVLRYKLHEFIICIGV